MQPEIRVPVLRVDHPGFTVPNLDQAISFFMAFGFHVVFKTDWKSGASWMSGHLDVDSDAVERMAQLTLGHGDIVELMEFQLLEQNLKAPRNSDLGGRHLALRVANVGLASEVAAQIGGVRLVGSPVEVTVGPTRGAKSLYLTTPWGMYLELIERSDDSEQGR